jgi:hypothetical protein
MKPNKQGYDSAYVDWVSSLAAAKITDPDFYWQVNYFNVKNHETNEVSSIPACRIGNGWMVSVFVVYKKIEHTEWLPIMGVMVNEAGKKMDNQALSEPDVFDWNVSVMRCLTKAIAVVSGFGLSIYARDDLTELGDDSDDADERSSNVYANSASSQTQVEHFEKSDMSNEIRLIRQKLDDLKNDTTALLTWDESSLVKWIAGGLNSLDDADTSQIQKTLKLLGINEAELAT